MKKFFIIFAFLILVSCGKGNNINGQGITNQEKIKITVPEESTVKKRYNLPEGYTRITYPEESF